MGDTELPCLKIELQGLSDAELASLIIELAGYSEAALALGEEAYRRLTRIRPPEKASPVVLAATMMVN